MPPAIGARAWETGRATRQTISIEGSGRIRFHVDSDHIAPMWRVAGADGPTRCRGVARPLPTQRGRHSLLSYFGSAKALCQNDAQSLWTHVLAVALFVSSPMFSGPEGPLKLSQVATTRSCLWFRWGDYKTKDAPSKFPVLSHRAAVLYHIRVAIALDSAHGQVSHSHKLRLSMTTTPLGMGNGLKRTRLEIGEGACGARKKHIVGHRFPEDALVSWC